MPDGRLRAFPWPLATPLRRGLVADESWGAPDAKHAVADIVVSLNRFEPAGAREEIQKRLRARNA